MASRTDANLKDYTICSACFCCVNSCYCKCPECLGCLVKSTILCSECFHSCGCHEIDTCCSSQVQCCCHDTRCAFPCTTAAPCALTILPYCLCYPRCACCITIGDIISEQDRDSDFNVDLHYITVCVACCCSISGSYCKFPECLGCSSFHSCLCLRCESYLRPQCVHCTCCKIISRCCFLDHRCAIPCEREVPFACTLLPFCLVFPCSECGSCCLSLAHLQKRPHTTHIHHDPIITVHHHRHTVTHNVIVTQQPSLPQSQTIAAYPPRCQEPPLATAIVIENEAPSTSGADQEDDKMTPLLEEQHI